LGTPAYRQHWVARIALESAFPNLQGSRWEIRSPFHRDYNCHAWGVCENRVRWEPSGDDYWPPDLRTGNLFDDYSLDNFTKAYERVGFRKCLDGSYELGYQKIAIYTEIIQGLEIAQHTARQTLFGRGWLSKLGHTEDIRHDSLRDIEGTEYGSVARYMKRSLFRALRDPSSVWIRATINHWNYRRRHPQGI